ncbi:terminase small subunit [Paenibacillus alvei]|uniref:terminase small subunit n=1 Tax=Paenibacillus alvei TaxID=44250 RepID=UPI0021D3E2D4|nr:terminase small subunit [Paenibacillus alvei]MCY9539220.1 terminase small subunit [Paenibacillus alvei]MCY9706734.1 terminase small subunit [Paenibacillus alvei]MCY9737011.1 terminase small subunit [Paenibacillus alvei]MCY9758821.1 terminase small subunit [Paenibacillus alvei]MEC0083732.1 terminase small subunit [Paenibacillus alvei]
MNELNERHKAFADYYIENQNGTESYKKAYPNCKKDSTARVNASKLLTNPNIQKYIKERLAEKEAERVASQDEVLEFLTQVMRGEVKDQLGLETPVKERSKAAELLGKRYALWTDKQQIDVNGAVQIIDDVPDG